MKLNTEGEILEVSEAVNFFNCIIFLRCVMKYLSDSQNL